VTGVPFITDFAAFWLSGSWRKIGRKQAESAYRRTVKTEADYQAICRSRDAYAVIAAKIRQHHALKGTDGEHYILHGSTWMNRWRDYVPEEERTETLFDEKPETCGLEMRAVIIRGELLREALRFESEQNAHRPTEACKLSKSCRYCWASKPQVPSIAEIVEKLT